jgi:uncharacterized protein (TIGR00269 family)
MKCDKCKSRAVADLKYLDLKLCPVHFSELIEKRVRRSMASAKMLDRKTDKIAVGVSGGKDSLVLLYLLKKMHYNIVAVTIDEGIRGYRDRSIPFVKRFCEKNSIPFHVYSLKKECGFTLDAVAKKSKQMCSYCGVLRRGLLNRKARELKCTKVATGHNLDDESQMVLMNLFRGDLERLARCGPVTGVIADEYFVPRVKPLRECLEREMVLYALLHNIEYADDECPYARYAYRNAIRELLNSMEERYPGTKIGILKNFDKMLPFLREYYSPKEKPKRCKKCHEITRSSLCKFCEMVGEFS